MLAEPDELMGLGVFQAAEIADHDDQGAGAREATRPEQGVSEPASRIPFPGPARDLGEEAEEGERPPPASLDSRLHCMRAGEHESPDTIPVRDRGPREQRGGFRGHHRLERPPGTEPHVLAEVHDEEHGAVPFLVEELRVDAAGPRGDPPVDAADIVPRQVGSRLGVFHPAAPQPRCARSGPTAATGAPDMQRQAGGAGALADEVGGGERHARQSARRVSAVHGTATLDSSASTTRSVSTPSASASWVSSTRCRSTSGAMAWMSCGAT